MIPLYETGTFVVRKEETDRFRFLLWTITFSRFPPLLKRKGNIFPFDFDF